MIIIHVLSAKEVTGAEVYAVTLANLQTEQGHTVLMVSDTLGTPCLAAYYPQDMAKRDYPQRLKNMLFLRNLISQNKADVVHAHSRAASWIARFAVMGTGVPLISTVHGRQHLHLSSKAWDMYGDHIIAVCYDLKTHLSEEMNVRPDKISIIPNGFNFAAESPARLHESLSGPVRVLTIAGRTTGPKGERTSDIITQVLPGLLAAHPALHVHIAGGEAKYLLPEAQAEITRLSNTYPDRFFFRGFTKELPKLLAQTDLLIAAGRTAIEGVWQGCHVLALGESQYLGPVTAQNFSACAATNFGDMVARLPLPEIHLSQLSADITGLLHSEPQPQEVQKLQQLAYNRYNLAMVTERVGQVYESAVFKKKKPAHIPVLMYHKIPDAPLESKHRIFVPKHRFEQHLKFLKSNGFTGITFSEYHAFKQGKKPLSAFPKKPVFLTFDDAYLDNLTNALPLLKRYGFKGTVFALGEASHTDNFWDTAQGEASAPLMNTAQMLQMQQAGMEFGGHSLNHPDLTTLSYHEAAYEISESRKRLQNSLSADVISFAYPYGRCNQSIKDLCAQAGYRYAVVIDSGGMHLENDPYEIFRAYIFPEDGALQLWKKTSGWYRRYINWKKGR